MFIRAEQIVEMKSSEPWMNEDNTLGTFYTSVFVSIKIIDTDFEDTSNRDSILSAIIDVYERRNLNVAQAIALYMKYNNYSNLDFESRKFQNFTKCQ